MIDAHAPADRRDVPYGVVGCSGRISRALTLAPLGFEQLDLRHDLRTPSAPESMLRSRWRPHIALKREDPATIRLGRWADDIRFWHAANWTAVGKRFRLRAVRVTLDPFLWLHSARYV